MTPSTTKQLTLVNKPTGAPVLSGDKATFKLETIPLEPLREGQVLARVLYFGNDVGYSGLIQADAVAERLFAPPVSLGTPMPSCIVATVIKSASDGLKNGDNVANFVQGTWSEYVILDASMSQLLQPLPNELPLSHYLGALGNSGLAAYCGLYYAANIKPEHTVVVSAAAGAVGNVAVQIAARIIGARRVIGITGSNQKADWVKDRLGAHACLNYNSPTFAEDLRTATPDGVDVFFDNTGGEVLDLLLTRLNKDGQVAACGAVSTYSSETPMTIRNWFQVVSMRIKIQGFILLDYSDKFPKILGDLLRAIEDGKLAIQDAETVVEAPLDQQPEVWSRPFTGRNQGKLITQLIVED